MYYSAPEPPIMKKTLVLLCSLLFAGHISAQDTLKLISHNIWNGFEWGKDTLREQQYIAWIKEQQPDIVAYQELCGYTEDRLQKQAAAYGHPYSALLKTSGYSVGLTSRQPITINARVQGALWHGMLHCTTYGVDFFVLHLSPFDWKYRMKEAELITDYIRNQNTPLQLVMGDFNAHSPFDADIQSTRKEYVLRMVESDRKSENSKNLIDEQLEFGVLSRFLSCPLIDICQRYIPGELRYSYPTQVFEKKDDPATYRERLDYILASPQMATRCVGADILNQTDTHYLSDHYPVMIRFLPVKRQ